MSGLCGWFGKARTEPPDDRVLRRMQQALPGHEPSESHAAVEGAGGLALKAVPGTGSFWNEGGVVCALEGYPYWSDPRLADLAREKGHGAALGEAYRRHGDDLLNHIHGPFSLSLWSEPDKTGLVAIDRMGIYPLCFARQASGVVFGATTDCVGSHPLVGRTISPGALYSFLLFYRVSAPQTIYEEQEKLAPGTCIWVRDGHLSVQRYWSMPYVEDADAGFDALRSELAERLRGAVGKSLQGASADATGAFLSGGLDSSTVVGVFTEVAGRPAKTYTIGFEQEAYDESGYAEIVARHFGAAHKIYRLTPADTLALLPRVVDMFDEPFGNSSAIPAFYCARMAGSEGVELMLAGDGGDEIFGGNSRYVDMRHFLRYRRLPTILKRAIVEPMTDLALAFGGRGLARKVRKLVASENQTIPELIEGHNLLLGMASRDLFEPEIASAIDDKAPMACLNGIYEETPSKADIHRMMYLDLNFALADNDLRKVGRMCELAGVRVRYPMLDEDLVAFSARIPPRLQIKGADLRYFFKKAMSGVLPEEVISKKKHGFGMPFGQWLREDPGLSQIAGDSLQSLKKRHFLKSAFIDRVHRDHRSGQPGEYGGIVWDLMMLELWLGSREGGRRINPEPS